MAEFGEQLRKAREAKGITQQSLAEQLYVTRQTVSRWECGNRYPDLLTTGKLSKILEVSVDDLLSEDDVKKVTERNPIIEKGIINRLVMVLYAIVSCSFFITALDIVIQSSLQLPQINFNNIRDIQILIIGCIGLMMQTAIFIYGFFVSIQKGLSPKKSGMIAMVYFFSVCLTDLRSIIAGVDSHRMVFWTLLIILPSVIGAVSSYLFFCKNKYTKICSLAIAIVSSFGMLRMIINAYMRIRYAGQFVSMDLSINLVLKSCIYLLFVYQMYILSKKRKLIGV